MIELKLVDESSFQAVLDLRISEADERARFVAPNVRSLADAWLYRKNEDVFPMAVYLADNDWSAVPRKRLWSKSLGSPNQRGSDG